MIGFGKKNSFEKNQRFRRPEFQEKLAKARRFQRQRAPVPPSFFSRLIYRLGLGSRFVRYALLLVVLTLVYFLVISNVFRVETVVLLSGDFSSEQVSEATSNLGKKRTLLIPQNHILLLSRAKFEAALRQELPSVRKVTQFRRVLPNKIETALEKRETKYIWQTGSDFYFLDQDGVVFQRLLSYEPAAYSEPLITDESQKNIVLGERLKAEKILAFAQEVREIWSNKISNSPIISYTVPTIVSSDVGVKTGSGFVVYFDLNRAARVQIENLAFILNSEIKPDAQAGLSYIDLRLPAVGYYCFRDAPCALGNATSTPR